MADILTLGELLIDLTQDGRDELGNGCFVAFPGGAPANVAVAAARLGASAGFVGKVGNDAFGRSLREVLRNEGIDTDKLFLSDSVPTTLAIVAVDKNGERDFTFYRNPGADTQLTADEVIFALSGRNVWEGEDASEPMPGALPMILHVGSLSLTTEPSKSACFMAIRYAKDRGVLISYDPNYRAALWDSEENAVRMMKFLLPDADILKVSDEEMLMLTGHEEPEEGSKALSEAGPELVLITLGADGVYVRCGDFGEKIPGFAVTVADTNGAGDTFLGAVLSKLAAAGKRPAELEPDALRDIVIYANKAASITCSRRGAIPAMPTAEEVDKAWDM